MLLGAWGREWILWLSNWKVPSPVTGVLKTSPWGALLWGWEPEGPGSLLFSFFAELSDLGDVSHLLWMPSTSVQLGPYLLLDNQNDGG